MNPRHPPLPVLPPAGLAAADNPRVCIVSTEFVGPVKNGGIGTAYTSLAEALAEAGCAVTCLFVGEPAAKGPPFAHWVQSYRGRGLRLVELPKDQLGLTDHRPHFAVSLAVFQWLASQERFDVVHFPELLGAGFHALTAKHQGLAFASTTLCVGIHSMTLWLRSAMQEPIAGVVDLELDFIERRCVELADLVVSPSQYLMNWIVGEGWRLPAQACVQPYVQPHSARQRAVVDSRPHEVDELVFFGRLETRKGLVLFCDALDELARAPGQAAPKVTFLGRENVVGSSRAGDYLRRRAKRWGFEPRLLTSLDQPEAIAYLREGRRLAVIPSLMENSPNTVYECLGAGIPFIASRAGGIPELIRAADADRVCFETSPAALAAKMREALARGIACSQPAVDAAENERAWIAWHRVAAADARRRAPAPAEQATDWPKVTVCIAARHDPGLLASTFRHVAAIDYPNAEVLVAQPESGERRVLPAQWRSVPASREDPPTRARLGRMASGEYLLFLDEHDCPARDVLKRLVAAAVRTGADIVACGTAWFAGDAPPPAPNASTQRWLPLGGPTELGALYNCFAPGNALIRRGCFEAHAAQLEDGTDHDEWEFYSAAALQGRSFEIVPEFLHWRRRQPDESAAELSAQAAAQRSARPYLQAVPAGLRNLIRLAQGRHQADLALERRPAALTEYALLTIRWRSKWEAARILAAAGQRQAAVRLLVDAVASVQSSKNGQVILEAMLAVGAELLPLEPKRAQTLARLAHNLAQLSPHEKHRQSAATLLSASTADPPARTATAANPEACALT